MMLLSIDRWSNLILLQSKHFQICLTSKMATDQCSLFLKGHVESTTNYNKQMEENALNYLGEKVVKKEVEDISVDDLLGDIDSMVDEQKQVKIQFSPTYKL